MRIATGRRSKGGRRAVSALLASVWLGHACSADGQVEAWAARHNGGFLDTDVCVGDCGVGAGRAMALDSAGNVYVTGRADNGSNWDYRTAKYAAADGSILWSVGYNGPANLDDRATAIAVDASGNAYVTGYSLESQGGFDYRTIKYSGADGTVLWSVGHAGPANATDMARAIALDAAGNAYVTGRSSTGANWDFRTIKYASADGAVLWSSGYNGPANDWDEPYAIAVDGSGNACVTGFSLAGGQAGYRTVKYAAADGALLWSVGYSGGSGAYAYALAMDAIGNAYVTGSSGPPGAEFRTIKYAAADGGVLWSVGRPVGTGDTPRAIAVDGSGNAYVAGSSWNGSNQDYLTIKHAAADGAVLWSASWGGAGNGADYAQAIAVDGVGNAYVTGSSWNGSSDDYRTIKYEAGDGSPVWNVGYSGPADASDQALVVAVHGSGNVYVTGRGPTGGHDHVRTVKYGADGTVLFSVGDGVMRGGDDRPAWWGRALAVDPFGSAYVSGGSVHDDADYLTVKHAAGDGSVLWSARFDGNGEDVPQGVALATDGLYVTGYSWNGASDDWRTIKHSTADGSVLWSTTYDGPAHGADRPVAASAHDSGSAYVTGYSWNGTDGDYRTIMYSAADGSVMWTVGYDGPAHGSDLARGLALDTLGNAYVTGSSWNGTDDDYRTLKYAMLDGAVLWSAGYGGAASGTDEPLALAVDGSGNAYVTGRSWNGSSYDYRTIKYASSDGGMVWSAAYDGAAGGQDEPYALALDGTGNAYVTGRSWNGSNYDFRTIKYAAADGSLVWSVAYDGSAHGDDEANALAVNGSGNARVAGRSWAGSQFQYRTIEYAAADGAVVWSQGPAGPPGAHSAYGVVVGPAGETYVTGSSFDSATGVDFLTIKYVHAASPSADLAVNKTDGQSTATPGTSTTYSIVVSNAGPDDVASATVSDIFPQGCTSVNWSCLPTGGAACGASGTGNVSDWAALPVGSAVTYTAICALSTSATGTLVNTATVSATPSDPNPADNSATDTDTLVPVADLALTLADDADPIPVFGEVTYTAAFANSGPSVAPGVTLHLALPPGLAFVSSTPGAPACVESLGAVTCALGGLGPTVGSTVSVRASAAAGTLGTVTASAQVQSLAVDPDTGNNAASEGTVVRFTKGDLQNDLATDLFLAHTETHETRVWLMDGTVRLSEQPFNPPTPGAPTQQVLGVDDFDGDHRNDLVFWDAASGTVEFWIMNGVDRQGAPVPLAGAAPLPVNWELSATADFDADGRPDIVWRNHDSQRIVIWLMNGVTKVGNAIPSPDRAADPNWRIVGAFDMNGDGATDFLWYNSTSGKIVYWWMDAGLVRVAGNFTTPPRAADANWRVMAVGDYGVGPDGIVDTRDIVWRNATSGNLVVWHMDLAGNRTGGGFTSPTAPTDPLGWTVAGPR